MLVLQASAPMRELPACLPASPYSQQAPGVCTATGSPNNLQFCLLMPCCPSRACLPARLPACPPACLPLRCCSNYNTATEEASASQLITLVSKAQLYMEGWALRGAPSGVPLNRTFIANVAPLALDPSNTVRRLPACLPVPPVP